MLSRLFTLTSLVATVGLLVAACTPGGSVDRTDTSPATSATPLGDLAGPTPTPKPNPYADRTPAFRDRQLLAAARSGNSSKIASLVEAGVDLEHRDDRGRTALLIASAADHIDAARTLIDAGADPDALDDRHDTPWLVTGVTGSVPMARVLLAASPDLTIRNRFGGISHIPASERGHDEYVSFVVRSTDIEIDHVNDLGWTALLEAVLLGQGTEPWQRIVEALVQNGANVSIADRDGVTALQHARRLGFTDIAEILERAT